MARAAHTRALVGLFDEVQQALDALDELSNAGLEPAAIGALMSDRTAERYLSAPGVPDNPASLAATSPSVSRTALGLRPVAALGMPGSGLVGTGELVAMLTAAGLGSRGGLETALERLGVSAELAHEVASHIKNRAVLIAVTGRASDSPEAQAALTKSARQLRLELDRPLPETERVISPPEAPAGDQRARYEPRLDVSGDISGHRTISTKFKS